ncbi:DUF2752 domain-containing protein [Sinomicrobium pectinilyticum]|uniref:DUF2752 domain-containing protein n=2 Tax=Sinomicrobium pectinilyticum TaxID=1084421 RepID=A0A3N0F4N1_SINP1|nr:DUF2752 domain-containing protein [Sinomicrobium pectinilyticum]
MLPCINRRILGFDCPGCGLQRSAALLFEGDFAGAFKMYPAIYPLLLLSAFLLAGILWKRKNFSAITTGLAIISVLFIMGNYILKFL